MTTTRVERRPAGYTPSAWVAAEIRAQIARQGLVHSDVAKALGVPGAWISRRIGSGAHVPLTLEDIFRIAAVLGLDGRDLVLAGLEDRPVVRHVGLEPTTRCLGAFGSDLRVYAAAAA